MSTIQAGTIQTEEGGPSVLTKQSASKAWWNFDSDAVTPTFVDSFNASSIIDNGVGNYDVTLTNAMANTNGMLMTGGLRDEINPIAHGLVKGFFTSVGVTRTITGDSNGSALEFKLVHGAIFGDLAA